MGRGCASGGLAEERLQEHPARLEGLAGCCPRPRGLALTVPRASQGQIGFALRLPPCPLLLQPWGGGELRGGRRGKDGEKHLAFPLKQA